NGSQFPGGAGRTRGDHLGCNLDVNDPWEPLRPTGAGDDAQLHFWQANFAAAGGDAVMHSQGNFQPTAETSPSDRCADRGGGWVECVYDVEEAPRGRRRSGVSWRDVS